MTNRIVIVIVGLMILGACKNSSRNSKPMSSAKTESRLFTKFTGLYDELMQLKETDAFMKNGVSAFPEWSARVRALEDDPHASLLNSKGVAAGDLTQLALAYVKSGGQETEYTRIFNDIYSHVIDPSLSEQPVAPDQITSTKDTSEVADIVGRWTLTNTVVNQSMPLDIYRTKSGYMSVIPIGDHQTTLLRKEGNRYYTDNRFGEYYEITEDGQLTVYDRDGLVPDYSSAKRD